MLLTFEPAEDGSQDVEGAMALVEATAWDGPLAAVRPARAQVFRLLSLPEPTPVGQVGGGPEGAAAAAETAAAAGRRQDELASYQALLTHEVRGI